MGIYIIEYKQNTDFVLGIQNQQAGASVVLRKKGTQNRFVLWDVNYDTGAITLNASGGTLAIDTQNQQIAPQVPLVLNVYNANAPSQRWDAISSPGFILSTVNAGLCIDDKERGTSDGNPTWLFPFNGSPAQQWNLVPLFNLKLVE